jgi:prepilin-type N-terminal cleavage/methylation domain-containing protein
MTASRTTRSCMRTIQRGFTLVELLIVVIILTVLAAIIVPQFSTATIDAKEAALDANLARMRSAIELYHAQHGGVYPGAAPSSGGPACTGGTQGAAAKETAEAFVDQMVMYSTATGATCTVGDPVNYRFGPYVRKGIPADSILNSAAVVINPGTLGAPLAPSAATGGWMYDWKSGQIVMNSNANDSRTKPYYTH